jgi:hypothetical protein
MTIENPLFTSHELRQLYWKEEAFTEEEVEEQESDFDEEEEGYFDDSGYLSLGDQEVGME